MTLVEVKPVSGHIKHDLGINSASGGGILHRHAGLLQHAVALLLALEDGSGNLILVEGMSLVQH